MQPVERSRLERIRTVVRHVLERRTTIGHKPEKFGPPKKIVPVHDTGWRRPKR